MSVDPCFNKLSLPCFVEVSKAQYSSSSLILARDPVLPAVGRQQMDVFVYISLHGFLFPSPLWGRSYVKGQKRGKWSGWNKLSGGSGKEGVCQRPVVSLSFLEQGGWAPLQREH